MQCHSLNVLIYRSKWYCASSVCPSSIHPHPLSVSAKLQQPPLLSGFTLLLPGLFHSILFLTIDVCTCNLHHNSFFASQVNLKHLKCLKQWPYKRCCYFFILTYLTSTYRAPVGTKHCNTKVSKIVPALKRMVSLTQEKDVDTKRTKEWCKSREREKCWAWK